MTAKRALRASIRARLSTVESTIFSDAGRAVAAALVTWLNNDRRLVALFASRTHEIDTRPLDALLRGAGVHRAIPLIVGDALHFKQLPPALAFEDLPRDRFGIPSPLPEFPTVSVAAAVVIVPGVAFDTRGGRLGYGRGYYDRALALADLDRCVGLALDEQLVANVPMDAHDVRLRLLCTPARGVFRTSG